MSQWKALRGAPSHIKDGRKLLLGLPEEGVHPAVYAVGHWVKNGRRWWDWPSAYEPTHYIEIEKIPEGE